MSGVASNGDAAGQAREYKFVDTSEIGDDYGGKGFKWSGGALAADGCIYCAPYNAHRILKIDPKTSTTACVGKSLGNRGGVYGGAAVCGDAAPSKDGRFVYFIQHKYYSRVRVLKFDIDSQNWKEIGDDLGDASWRDPVLAHDNCIYAAPHNGDTILKINPSNDSVNLLPVGLDGGYETSVLSEDKKEIFFIPSYAKQILRFNTETKESRLVGDEYEGGDKWSGGVLHDDGFVYAVPCNHKKILKYNPSDNTTELVGDDDDERWKFSGCFMGSDGCIYGIPGYSSHILRFDPVTTKCTLVGKRYYGDSKWQRCAQAKDGSIFAIPSNHNRVLKISLLGSNESAATRGINDTIDTPDLLGYDLYAQTLASHVESLYKSAKPLCVGLLAPWGTGKSFFWQLIREEFERKERKEFGGVQPKDKQLPFCWENVESPPRDPFMFAVWFRNVIFLCGRSVQNFAKKKGTDRNEIPVDKVTDDNKDEDEGNNSSSKCKKSSSFLGKTLRKILLPVGWILGIILAATVYTLYYVLQLISTIIWLGWKTIEVEARGYMKSAASDQNSENSSNQKDLEQGDTIGPKSAGPPKYIFVEFRAWTYRGSDDVWASLLDEIWTAVEDSMGEDDIKWHRAGSKKVDEEPEKYRNVEEATKDMKRRCIMWESIARLAIVALVVAIIVLSIWTRGKFAPPTAAPTPVSTPSPISSTDSPTASPTLTPSDEKIAWEWLLGIFLPLVPASIAGIKASQVKKYYKSGFKAIDEEMKKHDQKTLLDKFARKDFSQHKGYMGEVQKEVKFLISYLTDSNVRLVAFVDDLDRCDQKITMWILWAVKLLLSEGPISCWLAIDTKIVVDYIEADFTTPISGYQYLEKIINLPFTIPAMDDISKVPFIEGVLDAPELNTDQVYDKLCHLKYSDEYEILGELNSSVTETDGKLNELVILARKINAQVSGDMKFGKDELNMTVLKDNSKMSQSFYSKLLRVARTNLVSTYNNFYKIMENENWIGDALRDSDNNPLVLLSPRVDKDFKTLRSEKELASDLRTFLGKVKDVCHKSQGGVEVDLTLKGFEFTEMAIIVFERIRVVAEDLQDDADRINLFREIFCLQPSATGFGNGEESIDGLANQHEGVMQVGRRGQRDKGRTPSPVSDTGSTDGGGTTSQPPDNGDGEIESESSNGNGDANGKNDPLAPARIGYTNSSMVDSKEREFILEYAGFLSDVPRKIKRAVNVYTVTRNIAINTIGRTSFPEEDEDILKEKLFMLTLLQESFPYRTSWLVLMAICASGDDECEENTSGWVTCHLLLQNLAKQLNVDGKREKKTPETCLGDLPLNDVYDRIVFGMLHSLPNSDKLLRADTHTQHFKPLLHGLKLKDLYSDVSRVVSRSSSSIYHRVC